MAVKREVNGRWSSAAIVGALLAPLAWFGAQASWDQMEESRGHKYPWAIRHQSDGKPILEVKKMIR